MYPLEAQEEAANTPNSGGYISVQSLPTQTLLVQNLLRMNMWGYSLSILKRQVERNLSLIAALPNDGCYSKQRATFYVYLQTFCVRQILRMRFG